MHKEGAEGRLARQMNDSPEACSHVQWEQELQGSGLAALTYDWFETQTKSEFL